MQIGVIATGVASPVTLAKICPTIVFPFGKNVRFWWKHFNIIQGCCF
jgi:hypothetical protein